MDRTIILWALTLSLFTPAVQKLQAQTTWLLQAGAGPGSASVTVDQWGNFNSFGYYPFGSKASVNTFLTELDLYLRVGLAGPRAPLSGGAPTAMAGVPLTSCTNDFTIAGLMFKLDQSVAPMMVMPGPIQNGLILTQTYTITNTTAGPLDFDLVKYQHCHLGGIDIAGGRKAGPPESFLYYDSNLPTNTCIMEYTFTGGSPLVADRYEFAPFSGLGTTVANGSPVLANTIAGDGNADGLIDPANAKNSHATMAVRNAFNLAAGATVTYTVTVGLAGNSVPVVAPPTGLKLTGNPTVKEAGATGAYTVELLSAPTANVTVTMGPDSQVSVFPKTLTFTTVNWNVPQTVTVTAVDDAVTEGNHFGKITHAGASADAGYVSANFATLTVSIIDDDNLNKFEGNYPFCQKPPTILNVGEGAFGYSRKLIEVNGSKLPILTKATAVGPNGARVLNVAFNQSNGSGTGSTSNSGAALAIAGGLLLAAGLVLAAKKSAS